MASIPVTSWKIEVETVEIVADFILFGYKVTANGDSSREIKDACSLEEKLTKLDSILKSRDITSPTKVHIV